MNARFFLAWRMLSQARTQEERNKLRILRVKQRYLCDPLNLPDHEFEKNRYRLSKDAFIYLCQELRSYTGLRSSQRISLETKVLVALYFYAHGSYQRPTGVAKNISQKMCSVYIEEVTQALIHPRMLNKYIHFPDTPSARQEISHKFYSKFGLPGVIGCIDGSHFHIFCPPKEEEHLYYSRKHYHSLNVQMVCDSTCRILNVNAKFGGANHDSFIWENSQLNNYVQSLHQNREMVWLLGDSGYPQRPWLMTPFLNPAAGSPEATYNEKHMVARVKIENTFGRLKNRWRCLSKDRVLHYKPAKCAEIILACCVLHNLALDFNLSDPDDGDIEMGEYDNHIYREPGGSATTDLIRGRAVREQLVRRIT